MKKNILFFFLLFAIKINSFSQAQWKFHIAFEDGTGAKDTIWCIWDGTAHGSAPVDTTLGEGKVNINYNAFNVFIGNANGDTTKTVALPFFWSFDMGVMAINYQYPLSITWDSSLFSVIFPWPYASVDYARIDNGYFFYVNNTFLDHNYNMLIDNKVSAPSFNWFSQNQFPMYFSIARLDTSNTAIEELDLNRIKLFPNPTKDNISIVSSDKIKMIEVFTESGAKLISKEFSETENVNSYLLSLESLFNGFYLINIINFKNQIYHEKIIKLS